jgi:thiol-disulfide isomerase/thioredoxin
MKLIFPLALALSAMMSAAIAHGGAPRGGPSAPQKSARRAGPAVHAIGAEELKKILQRDPSRPRPLLVNFWATWCDPCREEFPDLVRIDQKNRRRGLEFITVSLDEPSDIGTVVPQFLKEMRAGMPAYLLNVPEPETAINAVDPDWPGALPATFLFDGRGQIVFKHFGRVKPDELQEAIDKTLNAAN